jgi:hypothetical protein
MGKRRNWVEIFHKKTWRKESTRKTRSRYGYNIKTELNKIECGGGIVDCSWLTIETSHRLL